MGLKELYIEKNGNDFVIGVKEGKMEIITLRPEEATYMANFILKEDNNKSKAERLKDIDRAAMKMKRGRK